MIFDAHEAGGWKAVYVSATAGEVTGADVERGIELFNRRSVDRGLREWTAEDVRAGKQTLTEEFEAVSEPDLV
ncbi:MAG TPA: hypothetical protein VE644_07950 [Gaiellaceae bacterium]|nr:hypothetical protein [Gaiellaceae bacterium]